MARTIDAPLRTNDFRRSRARPERVIGQRATMVSSNPLSTASWSSHDDLARQRRTWTARIVVCGEREGRGRHTAALRAGGLPMSPLPRASLGGPVWARTHALTRGNGSPVPSSAATLLRASGALHSTARASIPVSGHTPAVPDTPPSTSSAASITSASVAIFTRALCHALRSFRVIFLTSCGRTRCAWSAKATPGVSLASHEPSGRTRKMSRHTRARSSHCALVHRL